MDAMKRAGELIEQFALPLDSLVWRVFAADYQFNGMLCIAAECQRPFGESTDNKIVIVRLDERHLPDPAFGSNGFAEVIFDNDQYLSSGPLGLSLHIEKDAGLLILVRSLADFSVVGLARLSPDGTLDNAFGSNGFVVHYLPVGTMDRPVKAVLANEPQSRGAPGLKGGGSLLLASGKILYFGTTSYVGFPGVGIIARFLPDGSLDQAFGRGGVVRVEPPNTQGLAVSIFAVTELANGEVQAVGSVFDIDRDWAEGLICRYTQEGLTDTSFGNEGFVLIPPPQEFPDNTVNIYRYVSIAEVGEGAVVSAGVLNVQAPAARYGVVSCFDRAGNHDPSFNRGKPVLFNVVGCEQEFSSIAVQGDGKIVAAGYIRVLGDTPTQVDFLVTRLNPDGSRDRSFAGQGWTSNAFLPGINLAEVIVLDRDSILVLGTCQFQAVVMRFRR